MKKIVISASYFGINLGDEAILQSIVKMIGKVSDNFRIVILAWDKRMVQTMHRGLFERIKVSVNEELGGVYQLKEPLKYFSFLITLFKIITCDYFIWGGGGIINNEGYFLNRYLTTLKIAVFFKKPIFVFSIGVQMIAESNLKKRLVECLNKAKVISVRDELSKLNLIQMGVRQEIYIVADPAIESSKEENTCHAKNEGQINIKVGINLRPWFNRVIHKNEDKQKMSVVMSNLGRSLLKLQQNNKVDFFYFPFDLSKDRQIFDELQRRFPEIKIDYQKYNRLDQAICQLKEMDVFMGMRLHSLIFCLNLGIPFLALSYTEKTNSLLNKINYHDFSFNIEELSKIDFDVERLFVKIVDLIEKKQELKQQIIKNKVHLINEIELNKTLLKDFLYG